MVFTFSPLDWKFSFLGKFGSKKQNFQFMPKFGTYGNSNIQNYMVVCTFSVLHWKYAFSANIIQKIQIDNLG